MDVIQKIVSLLAHRTKDVDQWLSKEWQGLTPLPYFSCDIRNAGYKMGVVDTNLFPAGFNNLCNTFSKGTSLAFQRYFKSCFPNVKKIAVICEEHTRNKFYLMNAIRIRDILTNAGFECRLTMPPSVFTSEEIRISPEPGRSLTLYKPRQDENKLALGKNFTADIVLSNNDFSAGIAPPFDAVKPIIPNPGLGWHNRYKSEHFKILSEIVHAFGGAFSLDPWFVHPITRRVEGVDPENLSSLKQAVDEVLEDIRKKYIEYDITEEPYAFIKNDSGTYGIGQISVSNGDDVPQMNRKTRNKLFSSKAKNQAEKFIIQEGIPSVDTYSEFPIEPVIYGVGKEVTGGFFRIHENKNRYESLNSPGMTFSCLCLHKLDEPHEAGFLHCPSKNDLVAVSRFLAKLAGLAAAKEAQYLEGES